MDGGNNSYRRNFLIQRSGGRAEGKLDFANFETEPSDRRTRRPTDEKGPSATATTPARERYAATEEKTNHSWSERASEASHDECEKLSRDTDRKGERERDVLEGAQHADLKARFLLVLNKPLSKMKTETVLYIPDRHASLCFGCGCMVGAVLVEDRNKWTVVTLVHAFFWGGHKNKKKPTQTATQRPRERPNSPRPPRPAHRLKERQQDGVCARVRDT